MSDGEFNEAALQHPPFAHWLGMKVTQDRKSKSELSHIL